MGNKEVEGIIEEYEPAEVEGGRSRIRISGYWFSAFKPLEIKEKDYVEGTYIEKPNLKNPDFPYKNIITLETKERPKNYEEKQDERQTKIIRQACLKAAASTHFVNSIMNPKELDDISEQIIEMSKKFEEYINGD